MKKWIAALLLLTLVLCLAACAGGDTETTNNTTEPSTQGTEPSTGDTGPTQGDGYVVTVVDTEGKPIAGAGLIICKLGENGACFPSLTLTGADGITVFDKPEDEYKASFWQLPEGYTYVDEAVQEFYFASGSKELTITLKKA